MNSNIAVIIPTFKRPQTLEKLMENIHTNTSTKHTIYFVVEPDDQESIDTVTKLNQKLLLNKYPGSHTGAANTAYEETTEPFFIIANDDFNFTTGWDTEAFKAMEGFSVVGLNDGFSQGYTQITLVRRSYIQEQSGVVDDPNTLYHRGYHHNYVDTEFSETAKKRGVFTICPESIVEHLHYSYGKSKMDETYQKTTSRVNQDSALYASRRHLFT